MRTQSFLLGRVRDKLVQGGRGSRRDRAYLRLDCFFLFCVLFLPTEEGSRESRVERRCVLRRREKGGSLFALFFLAWFGLVWFGFAFLHVCAPPCTLDLYHKAFPPLAKLTVDDDDGRWRRPKVGQKTPTRLLTRLFVWLGGHFGFTYQKAMLNLSIY